MRREPAAFNILVHATHQASGLYLSASYLSGTGIDVYAASILLAVQALALLEEDECRACRGKHGKDGEPGDEPCQAVACDESGYGRARAASRPIDVAALKAQKFKRPLQPLEYRVILKTLFPVSHPFLALGGDAEEQRQCLCGRNKEDARADDHHNLLLQILLIARNALTINTNWNNKMTKETN